MNKVKKAIQTFARHFKPKPNKRVRHYPLNYHEKWLLPPLAVFVGIYMVLYSHHRSFGESLVMLAFYKATMPSVLAAWLTMRYIVMRTYVLDEDHPWAVRWWRGPWPRLLLQLWYGVAVPGFAVLIFYAFNFTVRGHALRFWKYVREDFDFVLFMLLGFNALLWSYHRIRTREIRAQYRHWKVKYGKSDDEVEAEWIAAVSGSPFANYVNRAMDSVALYEPSGRGNNINHAVGFDGKIELEMLALRDIYSRVEGECFFLVRPALILNRKAIRSIQLADDNRMVTIVLDEPRPGEEVKVSHRRTKDFLKWWREGGNKG